MKQSRSDTVRVWIVTDGKAGDAQPCRGITEHLAGCRAIKVEEHTIDRLDPRGTPDVAIASGTRALFALRRFSRSTFRAYLKRPRIPQSLFVRPDFVWQPAHDPAWSGAIVTRTGPHPFTPERIATARSKPFPGTTVVLGGDSRSATWSHADAIELGRAVASLPAPYRVLGSRRTPPILLDAMPPHEVCKDYLATLANASRILVTGDSHNMVSETLAFGVPTFVARPSKLAPKLARFLDALETAGLAQPLGQPERPSPGPVDATPIIAAELDRAFTRWKGDTR